MEKDLWKVQDQRWNHDKAHDAIGRSPEIGAAAADGKKYPYRGGASQEGGEKAIETREGGAAERGKIAPNGGEIRQKSGK